MIGAAMGLASRGAMPFPSTFAAFLSRAADFIRMAAISELNVKMAGSHAGVSIGEDGAVADGARGPGDDARAAEHDGAVPVRRRQHRAAGRAGRLSPRAGLHADVAPEDAGDLRPTTSPSGSAARTCCGRAPNDVATVVGAGVTVFEALKAHELLAAEGIAIRVVDVYSLQPIDADTLRRCARETRAG